MLRKFKISIDGKEYLVEMEEIGGVAQPQQPAAVEVATSVPQEQAVQQPMMTSAPTGEGTEIEAPMPGTILNLLVNIGDVVEENQGLLILEAMKMENEIVAPKQGTIIGIHVAKNETVDAGQVLITIG